MNFKNCILTIIIILILSGLLIAEDVRSFSMAGIVAPITKNYLLIHNPANNLQGKKIEGEFTYRNFKTEAKFFSVNISNGRFQDSLFNSKVKYAKYINDAADKYNVEPALIAAYIKTESSFNPKAESKVGAKGLMQLMPATAKELGVSDPFNPKQAIFGGTKYISYLSKRYKGNIKLTAAGYNAGPGNVKKAGNKVPEFAETKNYVKKIAKYYSKYKKETTVKKGKVISFKYMNDENDNTNIQVAYCYQPLKDVSIGAAYSKYENTADENRISAGASYFPANFIMFSFLSYENGLDRKNLIGVNFKPIYNLAFLAESDLNDSEPVYGVEYSFNKKFFYIIDKLKFRYGINDRDNYKSGGVECAFLKFFRVGYGYRNYNTNNNKDELFQATTGFRF